MHVHAGPVVAIDRLGHESRRFAVGVGDIMHAVLINLRAVRGAKQGAKTNSELVLTRRHLVVMLFHR